MNLKDFVKDSILEIAEGVNDAIKDQEKYGIVINPAGADRSVERIHFLVNVFTETEGKACIKVAGIDKSKAVTQQIDFNVNIQMPSGRQQAIENGTIKVQGPPKRPDFLNNK